MTKQLDIFGNETDVNEIFIPKDRNKLSIIDKHYISFGVDPNHKCGDCKSCIKQTYNNKNYYKCLIIGSSNSNATDIRLKQDACKLFMKKL